MEEPKDFQLLDDEDETTSSPLFDMSFNLDSKFKTNAKTQSRPGSLSTKQAAPNSPALPRPRPTTKFNISSNNPTANTASRLELKSIERPRSNSPMKIKGIDEFVHLYANKQNDPQQKQQTQNTNKIKMNLKMEDLLANVGKNETYQMLADFSVLTGDPDPLGVQSTTGFGKNLKNRKKSLDVNNDSKVKKKKK